MHKYVPAALPPGVAFSLQAIGLMTDDRRIIEIEGIKHNDPISLGAIAGNVFISSRVQARLEPTAAEQARRLLDSHVRRLVEHVGGTVDDVTHMTWGIGDPAFAVDIATECQAVWSGEYTPQLTIVEADFPHSPMPRVEFTASADKRRNVRPWIPGDVCLLCSLFRFSLDSPNDHRCGERRTSLSGRLRGH